LMIIHCLTDFAGFAASGEIRSTVDVTVGPIGVAIYVVVFIGYGVALLWSPRSHLNYLEGRSDSPRTWQG
jgi:hypothetical protein